MFVVNLHIFWQKKQQMKPCIILYSIYFHLDFFPSNYSVSPKQPIHFHKHTQSDGARCWQTTATLNRYRFDHTHTLVWILLNEHEFLMKWLSILAVFLMKTTLIIMSTMCCSCALYISRLFERETFIGSCDLDVRWLLFSIKLAWKTWKRCWMNWICIFRWLFFFSER